MAHPEQLRFASILKSHFGDKLRNGSILEIGSWGVNGSVRPIFSSDDLRQYVGVDLVEGPGVDLVRSGHEVDFDSETFELAISFECFEHNPHWIDTFMNMIRMTKPCGMVAVTCASRGRVEHGTSRAQNPGGSPGTSALGSEYYRNLVKRDFLEKIDLSSHFRAHRFFYVRSHRDLFFVGFKKGDYQYDPEITLNAISAEVLKISRQRRLERGPFKTALRELVLNIPLGVLSSVLPEHVFQRVIIPYKVFLSRMAGNRGKAWLRG